MKKYIRQNDDDSWSLMSDQDEMCRFKLEGYGTKVEIRYKSVSREGFITGVMFFNYGTFLELTDFDTPPEDPPMEFMVGLRDIKSIAVIDAAQ